MFSLSLSRKEASDIEEKTVYPLTNSETDLTIYQDTEDVYKRVRASTERASWQKLEMPLTMLISTAKRSDQDIVCVLGEEFSVYDARGLKYWTAPDRQIYLMIDDEGLPIHDYFVNLLAGEPRDFVAAHTKPFYGKNTRYVVTTLEEMKALARERGMPNVRLHYYFTTDYYTIPVED